MMNGRANSKGRPTAVKSADIAGWRVLRELGLSYPEIEKRTGVAADTVRYHLTRKQKRGTSLATDGAP